MKNRILLSGIFLLYCMFCPACVFSQVSSAIEGGKGLQYMQSARTYGKGAFVVGIKNILIPRETAIQSGSDKTRTFKDYPDIFGAPVSLGLTDEVDITAAFYFFNDARVLKDKNNFTRGYSEPKGGIGASRLGVKIRLPIDMNSRFQMAGKFGAILGSSTKQIDGMNYWLARTGTDIETSIYQSLDITSFLNINFEEGYVLSGSKIYDDQFVSSAGIQLKIKNYVNVNLELANRTFLGKSPQSLTKAGNNPDMYWAIAGINTIGNPLYLKDNTSDYKEDFLIFVPSLAFRINDYMTLDIGANINIANQVSPKEKYRAVVGLTFGSQFKTMIDSDADGINNKIDLEPNTPRGFPVTVRGIALDSDFDGVVDGLDKQPATPLGARVNSFGMGIDSDEDGVYDGIDTEPDTPKGSPVDKYGVAFDDDRDGIPNNLDLQPDTLIGAVVDSKGVFLDEDNDGVPDGLDLGPKTPKGAFVDKDGIALDKDGDGVPDGLDIEPNTPKGILVDKSGRALIKREFSIMREGLIRLNSISFAAGGAQITPDSYSILNEIGTLLKKYPSLKIQIGGHSDSSGESEVNYKISRERAAAVRKYLLVHYPEIAMDRLIAIGFGAEKPIAPNNKIEGRMKNRRVEFVVINEEGLPSNR